MHKSQFGTCLYLLSIIFRNSIWKLKRLKRKCNSFIMYVICIKVKTSRNLPPISKQCCLMCASMFDLISSTLYIYETTLTSRSRQLQSKVGQVYATCWKLRSSFGPAILWQSFFFHHSLSHTYSLSDCVHQAVQVPEGMGRIQIPLHLLRSL